MTTCGVIARYRDRLPPLGTHAPITLLEGDTPLLEAPRLARSLRLPGILWLKVEGANPTGSFKDRGMTVAITAAAQRAAAAVVCASTGNTAASAAAYAARAGLRAFVLLPAEHVALGKLSQALVHGARVLAVDGTFDAAMRIVTELAASSDVVIVNSTNPFRIEGQKTAAFEICDVLGDAPDYHALPVGNAGNISAYWKGYREYHHDGTSSRRPVMLGFQAEGAAPFVTGAQVARPETVASAIRIGAPVNHDTAVRARDESGGRIDAVSDAEILAAQRLIAEQEGLFVEPASAAPVAGLKRLAEMRYFTGSPTIVCTLTGHGLKDPNAVDVVTGMLQAPADVSAVRNIMGR